MAQAGVVSILRLEVETISQLSQTWFLLVISLLLLLVVSASLQSELVVLCCG